MNEETDLLQRAIFEINALRNQNNLMSARLEMFDSLMQVLNTSPAYISKGVSPDIVHEIEKKIASIKDRQD